MTDFAAADLHRPNARPSQQHDCLHQTVDDSGPCRRQSRASPSADSRRVELRQRPIMTTDDKSMAAASALTGYQRLRRQARRDLVADGRDFAAVFAFSIAGIVLSVGFALAQPQSLT